MIDSGDINDIYAVYVIYLLQSKQLCFGIILVMISLGLFDENESLIDSSFYSNPEFVESGGINVRFNSICRNSGRNRRGKLFCQHITSKSNILPVFNQDDAYSGEIRNGFSNATSINASSGIFLQRDI